MTSLRQASQYIKSCNPYSRRPNAEISRFVCARHHGASFYALAARTKLSTRNFATVAEPDANTQQLLDDYKKSFKKWNWNDAQNLNPKWASENTGKKVTICGYLSNRRDINKKLSFTDLRSTTQEYSIQIVSSANDEGSPEAIAHECIRSLRDWTPVVIEGMLRDPKSPRKQDSDDQPSKDSYTKEGFEYVLKEVELTQVTPLNDMPKDMIIKSETAYGPEHRHLQLRTDAAARARLKLRSEASTIVRNKLSKRSFVEIETPLLFKSTPEGAREFLVPTREKGLAYALPQSPQQYKQILMASGIPKYFQFAKCFRDEDLRADRQPEFTQLDIEIAFADEETVMKEIERLLWDIWKAMGIQAKMKNPMEKVPFKRMTYFEAMDNYGSDKPDLRYGARIRYPRLESDFISKITSLEKPKVEAFKMTLTEDARRNRQFVSDFFASPEGKPFLDNPDGQPATFCADAAQPLNGLAALGHSFLSSEFEKVKADLEAVHGDLLVFQARPNAPFTGGSTAIGNLRLALHKAAISQGLIEAPDPHDFKFLWVKDFPLFSPTNDAEPGQGGTAGLASTHHPFTAPKTAADVELLLTDPTKAVAAHYDLVVNGVEIGGGSRRIHNAEVQEFIFRDVLKMAPERIEEFRHLLDALKSGCPPHAGIALGWDRFITLITGVDSLRDVIAFPKNGSGEDVMVKSPNRATAAQWDTYHLQVKE